MSFDVESKQRADDIISNRSLGTNLKIFIFENKTAILSVLTTLVNVIVLSVVTSSLDSKVQRLVGQVDAQVIFWGELAKLYEPLVLNSKRVDDTLIKIQDLETSVNDTVVGIRGVENDYRIKLVDFNRQFSDVEDIITSLARVNTEDLDSVARSVYKIKPINDALELYSKILNHKIDSYNLNISTCEYLDITMRHQRIVTKIYSNNCDMTMLDGRLYRLYQYDEGFTQMKMFVNETSIIRYTNGQLHYTASRTHLLKNVKYDICVGGLTSDNGLYEFDQLLTVSGTVGSASLNAIPEPGYDYQCNLLT